MVERRHSTTGASRPRRKISRVSREGVRGLLRQRRVQAALVLAAAGSTGTALNSERPAEEIPVLSAQSAVLAPHVAEELRDAWRMKAVERESRRLATDYLRKGYPVAPGLAEQIRSAAIEHEIEPRIAFGLVRAESSFRNRATSSVGAIGLTQLMPRTAAWIEPGTTRRDLRDPDTNLRVGFKYLRYLLDRYEGDTRLALLAYNRGPGTVDRLLRRGRDPDNGYVEMVLGE